MFVKLHQQILDSSIANDRKLRHFFIDLLLLADPEGNVIMTPEAISGRTRASLDEVKWGLAELQKPDKMSLSPECNGKRIVPLEGHAYGWKVVNYLRYRAIKTTEQKRADTADRVRRWREKNKPRRSKPLPGEMAYVKAIENGYERAEQG